MYLKNGWVLKVGNYYIYSLNYNDLEHVSLGLCKEIEEATVFIDKEIEEVNDMLFSLSIYAKPIEIEMYASPKRGITEVQVMEWLDDNEFYCHITAETVLENAVDKGELSYYGTKYAVVRKPVVPQFVAKWYESEGKRDSWLNWFYKWGRDKGETGLEAKTIRWMLDYNEGLFVDMFKYGYEVEEQKYYICLPNISGENEIYIWYEEETGNYYTAGNKTIGEVAGNKIQFTEQEIRDYDPRYMAFAKPVEE